MCKNPAHVLFVVNIDDTDYMDSGQWRLWTARTSTQLLHGRMYIRIQAWNDAAIEYNSAIKRGDTCVVSGKFDVKSYKDNNGNDKSSFVIGSPYVIVINTGATVDPERLDFKTYTPSGSTGTTGITPIDNTPKYPADMPLKEKVLRTLAETEEKPKQLYNYDFSSSSQNEQTTSNEYSEANIPF